ncbi:NPC intracellular cholesterol transporter 2 [Plodia interpunctella]|uniref:NPC intracellular cholesterol transporter 2 n=1 Tax=Plodia interpunctella TaxID=58824 RepID=UPI002368E977|nr:NPC intracellular cholesterol transporter 2 [Plodia interpunctella]
MARICEVVFVSVTLLIWAASAADIVQQCPGRSIEGLSENVKLSPCKRSPCKLKKGTNQHISVKFTPENDIKEVKNHVTAEVFGVPLPFVGVDGVSICSKIFNEDGSPAACPLRAGNNYTYKDSFPVLSFYPTLQAKVHWALMEGQKEFVCFEIPVNIV